MIVSIATLFHKARYLFMTCVLSYFSFCSFSQATKFEIVIDGSETDYARSVIQTFDSGYAITGSSTSYGGGSADVFLLKLRKDGSWEWNKYFGGANVDWGYSLLQASDSGYFIAGITNSFGTGGYDIYLVRTNSSGDTLWTKTIGGADWDFSYYIEETLDGGLIISGSTFESSSENMLLVKLDAGGNIIWQQEYDSDEGGKLYCVRQCVDSGFIAVGEITSASDKDIMLMKVGPAGDSLWSRTFGSSLEDVGYFVEQTFDGGYILSGKFTDALSGYYEIAVIKTDPLGNSIFTQGIDGDSADDVSNCVHQCADSGYVLSGYTQSWGGGGKDYRLIKLKSDGGWSWGKNYGGILDDESFNMNITSDKGFVLVGETSSYATSTPNIYILKTDSDGVSTGNVVIGIQEQIIQTSSEMIIYPNPASIQGQIDILLPASLKVFNNHPVGLSLYDITGRRVYYKEIDISSRHLTLKNVATRPGMFFIRFDFPNKALTQKIIVTE